MAVWCYVIGCGLQFNSVLQAAQSLSVSKPARRSSLTAAIPIANNKSGFTGGIPDAGSASTLVVVARVRTAFLVVRTVLAHLDAYLLRREAAESGKRGQASHSLLQSSGCWGDNRYWVAQRAGRVSDTHQHVVGLGGHVAVDLRANLHTQWLAVAAFLTRVHVLIVQVQCRFDHGTSTNIGDDDELVFVLVRVSVESLGAIVLHVQVQVPTRPYQDFIGRRRGDGNIGKGHDLDELALGGRGNGLHLFGLVPTQVPVVLSVVALFGKVDLVVHPNNGARHEPSVVRVFAGTFAGVVETKVVTVKDKVKRRYSRNIMCEC
jgi:hypothetical protein